MRVHTASRRPSFQPLFLAALLCAAVFAFAACAAKGPVCTQPYIASGKTCCLDKNGDGRCDDANASLPSAAGDCSLCPPQFVTQKEQVIVYRYVCQNQTIMDSPGLCGNAIVSNAALFKPDPKQDPAFITSFDAAPACRGAVKAAELHLVLAQVPTNITFEVEDSPDAMPRALLAVQGKDDSYRYIGFCENDCSGLVDAQLPPTSAYLVRAVLRYPEKTVTTRDIVIDPTPDGAYGKKRCG